MLRRVWRDLRKAICLLNTLTNHGQSAIAKRDFQLSEVQSWHNTRLNQVRSPLGAPETSKAAANVWREHGLFSKQHLFSLMQATNHFATTTNRATCGHLRQHVKQNNFTTHAQRSTPNLPLRRSPNYCANVQETGYSTRD